MSGNPTSRPIVEVRGISKSFGPVQVLNGIHLEVPAGEIIGLVGENGAGKSTLMNIIAGALQPSAGRLLFNGEPVRVESIRHAQALGVRHVHQELSPVTALSVAENVFLGNYGSNKLGLIDYRMLNDRARTVLGKVGLGHIDPRTSMGSLRTGEQQLVELAKAIAETPRLLILDEPTSSLTGNETRQLFRQAHELAANGIGLILITHRLEEALEHCGRIVVLRDGRVVFERLTEETDRNELIRRMVGKPATFQYRPRHRAPDNPRLEVRNFADAEYLKPMDLEVRGGEIIGLFGLVGSGRTEFLESLYGFRKVGGGSIRVDGKPLRPGSIVRSVGSGVFMLPEGRQAKGILPKHSVRRNITLSALAEFSRFGFVDRKTENRRCIELVRSLNIQLRDLDQQITALSGGNQQRALFARALLAHPGVLLLDEPTHGVDVGAKSEIYEIIRNLAARGTSVIVASSELEEILAIADRCVVFAAGRMVADLDREQMSGESILAHAFAFAQSSAPPPSSREHSHG